MYTSAIYVSYIYGCSAIILVSKLHKNRGYTSKTRNNTVTKYLIGRSYRNDEFDWSFLFRNCIMRVMEIKEKKGGMLHCLVILLVFAIL